LDRLLFRTNLPSGDRCPRSPGWGGGRRGGTIRKREPRIALQAGSSVIVMSNRVQTRYRVILAVILYMFRPAAAEHAHCQNVRARRPAVEPSCSFQKGTQHPPATLSKTRAIASSPAPPERDGRFAHLPAAGGAAGGVFQRFGKSR